MKLDLIVTNLYSSDLSCNKVSRYAPEDKYSVYFQMYFDVIDTKTKESYEFELVVCTPKGLLCISEKYDDVLISDRAHMIYKYFDYEIIVKNIERIVNKYNEGNFQEMIEKMQRHFCFEYEDMKKRKK